MILFFYLVIFLTSLSRMTKGIIHFPCHWIMTIKDVLMNYHSPCTTTTSKISSPEMSHTFQPEACIRKPWVRRRAGIINSATDPSRTSTPIDGWTSGLGSCGNTLDQIHQRVWKWPSQRTTCHDRLVRPVLVDSNWWKWATKDHDDEVEFDLLIQPIQFALFINLTNAWGLFALDSICW